MNFSDVRRIACVCTVDTEMLTADFGRAPLETTEQVEHLFLRLSPAVLASCRAQKVDTLHFCPLYGDAHPS
jgi:hypothetical protein